MSLDALKPFFPNPCMRMKEICEILSDDPDLILETAYHIALFIISGKIKILMGDINQLQSFIIGCENLFSKPIPSKNILIKGKNCDGTQYEDVCIGYIDYTDGPGGENYDSVLGAAHKQYVELLGDYNYLSRDLHISPQELYDALYSLVKMSHPSGRTPSDISSPFSSGSNKDKVRIEETRRACECVREEIEQGKHGFSVNGEYRTNHAHFIKSAQALLGDKKIHRPTIREEWAKVPKNIKHLGRVPDQ